MKVAMTTWTLLAAGLAGLVTIPSASADPCPEDGPNLYNPLNGRHVFYFCNGWTGGSPNCTYQGVHVAPEGVLPGLGVVSVVSSGEACGGNCVHYLDVHLCDTDIWDHGT